MARERGLDYIGIVDHDLADGLEDAMELGLELGVAVVPGIEISAYDRKRGRKAHLLGFRLAAPAVHVRELCEPMLKARDARTREQVAVLAAAGYPVSLPEVIDAAGEAKVLYKQHIMSVLVRKGVASSYFGAEYRELFGPGGLCAGDIRYADAFDALRAIRADGGVAILAHPGQLDSWELLDELLAAGLDGVELYHESHSLQDHAKVLERTRAWPGLVLAGGSDDHGELGSLNAMGEIRAPFGAFEGLGGAPALPYRFVEGLVRQAGSMLRAALAESMDVELKGGDRRDLVTRHDSAIQDFLVSRIKARLPAHSFLAEEIGAEPGGDPEHIASIERAGPVWIIDPIDGTTNFARTGRDFSVSVALYEDGQARLGLVYDVMADELYSASPGAGAYLNGVRLGRLRSSASLEAALVDMSMDTVLALRGLPGARPESLAMAGSGHRALGCASINICRIAKGSLDLYLSAKLCPWDYAAAGVILSETGGASEMRFLPRQESGERSRRFFMAAGSESLLNEAAGLLFGAAVNPD
jgi:fructose-1,6-bisphosphatase/inositol monophosphatase family enzyme/predicted metal-dependent phosphoesterase TrpH